MGLAKVLVFGGRGYFGRLIIEDLQRYVKCHPVVASRKRFQAAHADTVVADLEDPASLETALSGIPVVICAAGPFQRLPTTLAELCLRRGIHYIDVADDRGFVGKVRTLVQMRSDNVPAICTAWSTVSALTGLLVRIASESSGHVDSIYIHMAPGNRGARNAATIGSLLHSVGQAFSVFRDGSWQIVRGWSEPRSFSFPPPIGRRTGYLVNVPDHELFPELFGAHTVEFRVGSELELLNSALSLLGRTKKNWSSYDRFFQRTAAMISFAGHDWGAVGVEVAGSVRRRISLVAHSEGQRIAAMPASVMTGLLLSGASHRGLVSYGDWLTPEQFREECEKRGFQLVVEEL